MNNINSSDSKYSREYGLTSTNKSKDKKNWTSCFAQTSQSQGPFNISNRRRSYQNSSNPEHKKYSKKSNVRVKDKRVTEYLSEYYKDDYNMQSQQPLTHLQLSNPPLTHRGFGNRTNSLDPHSDMIPNFSCLKTTNSQKSLHPQNSDAAK